MMKHGLAIILALFLVCGSAACQATKKQQDNYESQLRKNDENYDPNSPLHDEHDPYNLEHLKK